MTPPKPASPCEHSYRLKTEKEFFKDREYRLICSKCGHMINPDENPEPAPLNPVSSCDGVDLNYEEAEKLHRNLEALKVKHGIKEKPAESCEAPQIGHSVYDEYCSACIAKQRGCAVGKTEIQDKRIQIPNDVKFLYVTDDKGNTYTIKHEEETQDAEAVEDLIHRWYQTCSLNDAYDLTRKAIERERAKAAKEFEWIEKQRLEAVHELHREIERSAALEQKLAQAKQGFEKISECAGSTGIYDARKIAEEILSGFEAKEKSNG